MAASSQGSHPIRLLEGVAVRPALAPMGCCVRAGGRLEGANPARPRTRTAGENPARERPRRRRRPGDGQRASVCLRPAPVAGRRINGFQNCIETSPLARADALRATRRCPHPAAQQPTLPCRGRRSACVR